MCMYVRLSSKIVIMTLKNGKSRRYVGEQQQPNVCIIGDPREKWGQKKNTGRNNGVSSLGRFTVPYVHVSKNRALKYMKQKLRELQGETDKYKITVR